MKKIFFFTLWKASPISKTNFTCLLAENFSKFFAQRAALNSKFPSFFTKILRKILVLLIASSFPLLLGIAACKNQPKTVEAAAKSTDSTDLAFVAVWKGKYPADINILAEKTALNQRIKALLKTPEIYGEFAERCAVQSPIEWQDSVLFLTACAPHACTYDEMAVCLDKKTNKMWVVIVREGFARTIGDDNVLAKPKRLNDYLTEH